MAQFIDRRLNGRYKGAVNRQRFLRRFKAELKQAVSNAMNVRHITDIESGERILLSQDAIQEPRFQFGKGGRQVLILAGNQEFLAGDRLKKPKRSSTELGTQTSASGEGLDTFDFHISQQEFLDLFFENLELPLVVKAQVSKLLYEKKMRSGFITDGIPSNVNIIRSYRAALGRRYAMAGSLTRKATLLMQDLENLLTSTKVEDIENITSLQMAIQNIQSKIKKIPFLDPIDLRYTNKVKQHLPCTQAVMFCLMDVSGSMDETKKEIAKRFFILLYLFLKRNYQTIDVVFIRHHTSAKEVSEQDFFHSKETGGTVVSSALELMKEIIKKRYPVEKWNIYGAQASDGDNWNNDAPRCHHILNQELLPLLQYFAYIEILPRHHQSLWEAYLKLKTKFPHFSMQHITHSKDIYPVFKELFKKQEYPSQNSVHEGIV